MHTSLQVYERYVRALTIAEKRAYYEEQKTLGEQFGVPRDEQPADYAAFNAYFDGMLSSDRIAVTAALRDVADATLRPDLPFVARPVVEAINLATAGMLPPALRDDLGLPWGAGRERVFEAGRRVLRAVMPALPSLLRDFPPARSAERRVRAA